MSSTYGERLKLTIFGQSHGPAIGMTLDGIPAGLPVDTLTLQAFLNRRAPSGSAYSTSRKESDLPEFLCGIVNDHTCGAPISAIIHNEDCRSKDYATAKDLLRPGHADFTAHIKYGSYGDTAGGGHFSGRLTAPLCIAGGLCKQWLSLKGIEVNGRITQIGSVRDTSKVNQQTFTTINPQFPVTDEEIGKQMIAAIADAKSSGDSLGGIIECIVTGLPAGVGEPIFGGLENKIAQIIFGIPAVKGIEFGLGFAAAASMGSENNDPFGIDNGRIVTLTNNCGGILGGISTGMPLVFRVAIKPTPTIAAPQKTVSLRDMQEKTVSFSGRHDPCIVPRAVAAVEAAAAIAIFDTILA